jgi:hypothetical protein
VIGNVSLILSTTDNQGCAAGRDTLVVSYHVPPTVDAGASVLLCDGLENVQLNGVAQNAGSVQWFTTGTGTFSPAADVANAVYTPTANDSIVGGVYLILTGFGTGTCGNSSDSLFVDIGPTRIANAGNDQTTCADGDPIQLNGDITGVTGGVWSTTGTGSFLPDNTTLGAAYVPSATDMVFGELEFILTTTGNLGCPADTDTMTVSLQQPPTVDAGADINVCDASDAVQLGATSTVSGCVVVLQRFGCLPAEQHGPQRELPARYHGRATGHRAHDPHQHRQRCVCCGDRYVVPQLHQPVASSVHHEQRLRWVGNGVH